MSSVSQLKRENVLQILQLVKSGGETTKPELALQSGLTITTVQNIIASLETQGLVSNAGIAVSNGGRKAQKYCLNKQYRYLVGVYLRTNKITLGIFDYTIGLLHKTTWPSELKDMSVEETIRDIVQTLYKQLDKNSIQKSQIAGIGINVPGPVDYENGRVVSLRGFRRWKNIALKERIEELSGIPTFVDKDVNSGILLLKWLKRQSDAPNMLYISVEDGIGSGVMIGGKIYRGNRGVAGEIGHITVQENGQRCACGNVGCLETVSSDFAIIDRVRREVGIPLKQALTIDDVIAMSHDGNETVNNILASATAYLATTIRNSFMLYDPDEISINCKWLFLKQQLFFDLIDSLYDDNTLLSRGDNRVTLIDMEDFGLRSAGAIVATHEIESVESSVFTQK